MVLSKEKSFYSVVKTKICYDDELFALVNWRSSQQKAGMGGLRQKIDETKIVNDKFSVTRDSKMKMVFSFQKMPK